MHVLAILMTLLMSLLMLAVVVFWVWTIVDCVMNKRLSDTQKIIWALVIFFLGFIGSLIYLFAGRSSTSRSYQPAQPQYYYQPQPYHPTPSEQIPAEEYRAYQEGYQAQNASRADAPTVVSLAGEDALNQTQVQYEHIQISYPE